MNYKTHLKTSAIALLLLFASAGCDIKFNNNDTHVDNVPRPINLIIKKKMKAHGFTQIQKNRRDIDLYIKAIDAFQDGTKAFGDFRFELYELDTHAIGSDKKGKLVDRWECVGLDDPKLNATHWDRTTSSYHFKLQTPRKLKADKYILSGCFKSRFSSKIFFTAIIDVEK